MTTPGSTCSAGLMSEALAVFKVPADDLTRVADATK